MTQNALWKQIVIQRTRNVLQKQIATQLTQIVQIKMEK